GIGLLWVPLVATAQQPVKLIGILGSGSPPSEAQRQQSPFRHKLRELGWHEGHNIAFEGRYAEGETERLPDRAAALVRLRPDIIVTGVTPGVRAVQQMTTTIPIVSAGVAQLVEQGSWRAWRIPVATSQGWKSIPKGYGANASRS